MELELKENKKIEKGEIIQRILSPMIEILDKKNITNGITIVTENGKLYVCFDKNCLSDNNQLILEKISYIYSETLFYSDNKQSPNSDRLEYWCPDEHHDERTNITERCRNKKMFVLELYLNDTFTILGTSIMLANALQEQDPLHLKFNQEELVLDADIIERHEHYIAAGSPDLRWINLYISLNIDNPLRENQFAPSMSVCEINSPVSCDKVILSTLVGYNEKTYITFNMEKEELEKAIKGYFQQSINANEQNENITLNEVHKRLLTN